MRKKREPAPSAEPPQIQEHHVRLPGQVAEILGAAELHRRGITGKGVRVAVIDSGFFPHPYYEDRGYRIERVVTFKERHPEVDEYGHGTAQLASLLSIAPESEVLAIKCMDRDPCYALKKALALKPRVLSCAWGFNIDHPKTKSLPDEYRKLHRLLLKAIHDDGVVVVAAAGNGQHAFPGSMPEVISTGGVYYSEDGRFEPSDLSSRYASTFFPGREVPDLCGLVGNRPHGRLLLVPVPPRASLARKPGFSTIAAGPGNPRESDRQKAHGWAMFSGTSASTAMVSGAAALLLQCRPELSPAEIKSCLLDGAYTIRESGCRVLSAIDAVRKLETGGA